MGATKATAGQTLAFPRAWLWVLILLLLPLAALVYVLLVMARLRRASRQARQAAAVSEHGTLLLTYDHAGRPGDPLTIEILASAGQVGAAFAVVGWYGADEIDLLTSLRIIVDSLLKRKSSTAPVSNLYLYGRKEDLAFERPGSNVRQRDHIRLWSTGQQGEDHRPIWLGGATEDIKIELAKSNHLPTHGISPDLDAERNLIVTELTLTGYVIEETTRPGLGKETHGLNGSGDPYFTYGQVTVLVLANVRTTPLATQVLGPLVARLARSLAGLLRARLPQAGLERAENEHKRLNFDSLAHVVA